MTHFTKATLFTGVAAALLIPAPYAQAAETTKTVTTRTIVQPHPLPGVTPVDFSVFDVNGDGFYSMPEVGEHLFKLFDQDANGHIDNREWKHKAIITITPMTKETFKFIDKDSDGVAERTTYTYQTFYEQSGLAQFTDNSNGLSPQEFLNVGYRKADKDDDNLISLEEWKEAYLQSRPRELEQSNYNN